MFKRNYIEDHLRQIRSSGRLSFTWNELKIRFEISDNALNQRLYQLKSKGRIAMVRKGFYVIIPPEYSHYKMLPPSLFIDDLMKSIFKPYYVGLYSAAAFYGAAHQQPLEYTVVTLKPALRQIALDNLKIKFFVKNTWSESDILDKKTDSGYIKVSSPELTALDLLYYTAYSGINRIATVLKELTEQMKPSDLYAASQHFPETASIQRLGYILDKELNQVLLSNSLKKALKNRKCSLVSLTSSLEKKGIIDKEWFVQVYVKIETDI